MLSANDAHLSEESEAECEGEEPLTLQELTGSLESMPRAEQPGSDGIPYEVLQKLIFCFLLGKKLLQTCSKHSNQAGRTL